MRHPLAVETVNPMRAKEEAHFYKAHNLLDHCRQCGYPTETAITILQDRLDRGIMVIDGIFSTSMLLRAVKSIIAGEAMISGDNDQDEVLL